VRRRTRSSRAVRSRRLRRGGARERRHQQELPCPGKNARYWDTGLVRSELLTEDCEVNGQRFKAGTRLEFDENGALITTE
jgi:hypothetical protein